MTPPTLKYCSYDPDRHGNDRWYARKRIDGVFRRERIHADLPDTGVPSAEFMEAYWAALAALEGKAPATVPLPREDSFAWLWDQYLRSREFRAYDRETQRDKRSVLGRWVKPVEALPYRKYRQQDVIASRDRREAMPAAADKLVKYLRVFFGWAIAKKHMTANPAEGVEKIHKTVGWHTWAPAEVEQYRARHPIGTKARLALELMLQVGARISDAARLGRQHERDGGLSFIAYKGRNRSPQQIDLPIRKELRKAMAPGVVGDLTYLVTEYGASFSIKGLGQKFRTWCDEAELPHCSAHGLRKAAATELAENGVSAHGLMAVFGWTDIETAMIYTRAADRKRMARSAINLGEHRRNKSVALSGPKKRGGTISGKSDD